MGSAQRMLDGVDGNGLVIESTFRGAVDSPPLTAPFSNSDGQDFVDNE